VKHLGAIPVRGKTAPINLYTVAALLVPAAAETSAVTAPPVEA
jgi:hypothetical protein